MCHYPGWEIVQKCREIRDLQMDLSELLRQDRETYHRGDQARAARRVLAGDEGAMAVLEGVTAEAKAKKMVEAL
jgi:hypothetical protein